MEEIKKEKKRIKFNAVVGNPPYQSSVGNDGGNDSKAVAIYHKFIDVAKELDTRFISMITPSRWMTKTAASISDEWVDDMINCNRLRVIYDHIDATECFNGVEIKGGVWYFLYDKEYNGKCDYSVSNNGIFENNVDFLNSRGLGILIRDINNISIIDKIEAVEGKYFNDVNFSSIVSSKDFHTTKTLLTSNWNDFKLNIEGDYNVKYFLNKSLVESGEAYIKKSDIVKNPNNIDKHRVLVPAANGGNGTDSTIIGKPFYCEPESVCSQTYLVIGYDSNFTKNECYSITKYIKTQFLRYLVSIKKSTQNAPRGVYQFVPMQDFSSNSDIDWSKDVLDINQQLYKKYKLSEEDIANIEKRVRVME